ncbi:succinyltransferase [Corynebacterium breve]|uniref:Succinyltransferase n=1 Tax=Corynebacterium breve TaxID=3049799 RepID=A0ABY8VGE0_9CORY|nr:succinyltransferase [Corynebacterium breve]WIM68563.1 succinyltransferase [Corynebacterium breve]
MRDMTVGAHAIGIANIGMDGTILDTWYPDPELIEGEEAQGLVSGSHRLGANHLPARLLQLVRLDEDRMVEQVAVRTTIADLSQPPVDAHDVYLRLHLLSHRIIKPLELNMEDLLEHLVPVVWTNKGPCLPDNFEFVRGVLRTRGLIHVYGIERLPRMVDYVVPAGVSIAEAERVRLGAYLAPGTNVLREGYVSYNAGSLGASRIEGRLSSSVVVGEGTDVGLSATILALHDEGHNRVPLHLGKNCTMKPSAGLLGIEMGDNCTLGTNVMLEPTTMVHDAQSGETVSALDLSGKSNWSINTEPNFDIPVLRWV